MVVSTKKHLLGLSLILFAVLCWDSASAAPPDPQVAVKDLLGLIRKIDKEGASSPETAKNNEMISTQAIEFLDLDKVSQKTLGKHWKKRTSKEKKLFTSLLTDLFKNVAFPNSAKFFGELELVFGAKKIDKGKAIVPLTVVHKEEGEVGIDFILEQNSKNWKVVDVILDGTSMRNNLRAQFYKVIKKDGFNSLARRMENKLRKAKSG